jgi:hypothetical protein
MPKLISIVIPSLNEEKGIKKTIDTIPIETIKSWGYDIEIIVVDGDSSDNTVELAQDSGARVVMEKKRGYGQAYKTGFEAAKGDIIITMDADASYPSKTIPLLVQMLEKQNLDFITTNRFSRMSAGSMSLKNKIGNLVLSLTTMLLFRLPFRDSQSGMWALRRSAWEKVKGNVKSDSMAFSQELKIAMHLGRLNCREVDIAYDIREGKPKLNPWKDGINNLVHLLKKRIE